MYTAILLLHSYLRWAVLLGGLSLTAHSLRGWRAGKEWEESDEMLHRAFIVALDCQLTVGLWLYGFLSPLPHAFWAAPASTLHQPALRFFGVEHITAMIAAITLLHIARLWSKKASGPIRHRRVWTTTLAALLIVVVSIPWPGLAHGRPLLRGLTG